VGVLTGKAHLFEFDVRVFPVEDVSVRGEVLPVQRRIEFREHLVRIEEDLQIRPFDQQRLVALPAFAVNQVRIEGTVFVGNVPGSKCRI